MPVRYHKRKVKKKVSFKNKMKKTCKNKGCENEFVAYSTVQNKCDKCRLKQINEARTMQAKNAFENIEKKVKKSYTKKAKVSNKTKRLKAGESEFIENSKLLRETMICEIGYVFCEKCKRTNGEKYECHHIFYRSEKPSHSNLHDVKNLIILCNTCHNEAHSHKTEWRQGLVEERGLKELFN